MRLFTLVAMLIWGSTAWAAGAIVDDSGKVKLRSGKGDNYRVIRTLPGGSEVELLTREDAYAQVRTQDGQTGWLPERLLRFPIQAAPPANPPVQPPPPPVAGEVAALKAELTAVRTQLEVEQKRAREYIVWAVAAAIGTMLAGTGLGAWILAAYYRKKLNGLRI